MSTLNVLTLPLLPALRFTPSVMSQDLTHINTAAAAMVFHFPTVTERCLFWGVLVPALPCPLLPALRSITELRIITPN